MDYITNYLKTYSLTLDEVKCEICGNFASDIHHIIYRSEAPRHPFLHHPVNLIALCRKHHEFFHKKKSNRGYLVKERKLDVIFDNLK